MRRLAICLLFVLLSTSSLAQNAALVVIDMQPHFSERDDYHLEPLNQAKVEQILKRQQELIRLAKKRNIPILMIEYQGCGQTCEVLAHEIGDYPNTRTFVKSRNGMFDAKGGIAKDLKDYLDDRKVTELIVTGANGGYCVKCSIEGALNNGYRVWTDPHAIADFNHPFFIYPYSYSDGRLDVKPDLMKKLNQRPNMENFDEILNAENIGPSNPSEGAVEPSKDPDRSPPGQPGCLKNARDSLINRH